MTKVRRAFIILAFALGIPVLLLVVWSVRSVIDEEQRQTRAVASRIFDEMEHELGELLREEEARALAHYQYEYLPEGARPGAAKVRSPLGEAPERPFIIGYFQLDRFGQLSSPRFKDDEVLDAQSRSELAQLDAAVAGLWSLPTHPPPPRKRSAALGQVETKLGLYDALESLNRSVVMRESRKQEAPQEQRSWAQELRPSASPESVSAPSPVAEAEADAEVSAEVSAAAKTEAESAAAPQESEEENVAPKKSLAKRRARQSEGRVGNEEPVVTERKVAQGVAADKDVGVDNDVPIQIEPMVSRLTAEGSMILYRTVLVGERTYRQGLVLNTERLIAWLNERVIAPTELAAHASVSSVSSADAQAPGMSATIPWGKEAFAHRFVEPFGHLVVALNLTGLPGTGGGMYVYSLGALLAVAITGGLYAAYRMVAVTVTFAERRNNFVSAVTHELKTPLTSIRLYSEMLRDGIVSDDDKRQKYYRTITAESERLTRLINNVLELSRIERQQRPMNLTVGDVRPVIEEVLTVLAPHAKSAGFTLSMQAGRDVVPARFERDALLQVLFNLVDNAIKYAVDAADKNIIVSVAADTSGGVLVSVADKGPGVPLKHLSHVFEPFYRGQQELTRTAAGTGIGLALVRGLVAGMGGRVTAANTEPGFAICVRLPPAEAMS